MAYGLLVLACQVEISFGAVEEAQKEDLPDGDAALAWKNLLAIYQPDTVSNKFQLLREFTSNVLTDVSKNPDAWIDELANTRKRLNRLGIVKGEEDMILHILEGLPKEYDALITVASNELDNSTNPMTLDSLRRIIRSHYQRLQKNDKNNNNEEALTTYQPFKGRCRNCGKFGHHSDKCRLKNNNFNQSTTQCNNKNQTQKIIVENETAIIVTSTRIITIIILETAVNYSATIVENWGIENQNVGS
jgi:hypothetical protein